MTYSLEATVVDELLTTVGWWGRYQRVQFLMAMIPCLSCAFHAMSVIFIGRPVDHTCAPVDSLNVTFLVGGVTRNYDVIKNQSETNLNVTYGSCSIDVKNGSEVLFSTSCISGYRYAEPVDRSFVSQYDLVCERESLADVSQTLLAMGMMVGAFVFTSLADRYGRKPMFMVTHLGLLLVAGAIAFSPNVVTFLVLRFFVGALQQGLGLVTTIMLVELLPKDKRALPSMVGNFFWAASLMVLCLIAYLTRDVGWRYTELVLAGSTVTVLVQWWVSDETLRWLNTNNKHEELERVVLKAARTNKVDWEIVQAVLKRGQAQAELVSISTSLLSISESIPIPKSSENQGTDKSADGKNGVVPASKTAPKDEMRLLAFVKNRHVMMMTAVSCFMWFTDSITYYGLLLTSSSLADNVYLGFFLSVLAEVPTGFVFILGIDRFGRKRCLVFSHLISALSLLTATVLSNVSEAEDLPGIKIVIMIVSLLGKFGVSLSFSVIWLYSSELFPTNLRNTGFGISSVAARIGGMIAPFSRTFSRYLPWGPGAVFTCLCMLVPVVIRFLPETTGEDLPQTLEDLDKWFQPKVKASETEKKAINLRETGKRGDVLSQK